MDEKVTIDIELITKLADDVWELANEAESLDYELCKKLKRLSSCLHDIRANHDTKWYKDKK